MLIAEPFLEDPSFERTVILLCENDETGTFGLVMNKPITETLGELVPAFRDLHLPVYAGGPVEEHTLHVLHRVPHILGGVKIGSDIYFGTDMDSLKSYLLSGLIDNDAVKFFVGYSGWSAGQLDEEIAIHSWLVAPTNANLIFSQKPNDFYKDSLEYLGDEFKYYFMLPKNPSLN